MMIGYKKSDAVTVWPEGDYEGVLLEVSQEVSRAGNDMYKLTWRLYSQGGKEMTIFDYVVFPEYVWKLKKVAVALGVEDEFNAENFDPANHRGKSAVLTIKVKSSPDFGEQNSIHKYGAMTQPTQKRAPAPRAEPDLVPVDTDVPF